MSNKSGIYLTVNNQEEMMESKVFDVEAAGLTLTLLVHGSCLISLHLPNFLRFTVTLSTKENAIVLPSVLILEVHL